MDVPYIPKLHTELFARVEGPFSTTMPPHLVVAAPSVRERKWAIVEMVELKPLYEGEFEQDREQRQQEAAQTVQRSFSTAWFDVDNVYKRAGFVPAQPPSQ